MVKKTLLSLLLLTFTFSFLGCKPPADLTTNVHEEQFEDGATQITMWSMDFEDWNNVLNQNQKITFNDNLTDGIQLEQVFVEITSFDDQIRSARETGNIPDIYMLSYGNLYRDVQNGYVADMTDLLPQSSWDDLYDVAKAGIQYDGKYYAYPSLLEPSTMLFYRKDLLQTYGNTTEIPTNWADFVTLLETIKTNISSASVRGLYAFDVPKGIALGWGSWGLQLSSTGGLAISDDWTTSRITNNGYTQLATLWQTLFTDRLVPLSSGDYTEIINDLCLGKLVMTTAGSWSIATIMNEYPNLVDQIGVAAMPTFDGNQNQATATNGGWVYVISSECENKDLAAKVIEFLVAGDIDIPLEYFRGASYSKASPRISVTAAIQAELLTQSTVPSEWIRVVSSVASYAPMEPIYPWDISIAVSSMLENVALGNSIASEVSTANTTITNLIQTNNLANNNPRE